MIEGGRVLYVGPVAAGQDVEMNARANVPIPNQLDAISYEGDSGGLFGGVQRTFRLDVRPRF